MDVEGLLGVAATTTNHPTGSLMDLSRTELSDLQMQSFWAGECFLGGVGSLMEGIAVTAGISLAKEDRSSALAAKGGWPTVLG